MTLNRSEILFIYDAQDCNPNGNPIGDNRPDAILTPDRESLPMSVSSGISATNCSTTGSIFTSKARWRCTAAYNSRVGCARRYRRRRRHIEEIEDVGERFLAAATDVRYFGATMSFESSDDEEDEKLRQALGSALPNQYQGRFSSCQRNR